MRYYHRNRQNEGSWEKKKRIANEGDFALMRLLIGVKATELVRKIMKLAFLLAIIILIAAAITKIKFLLYGGIAVGGIGLISLALIFSLSPIGMMYNYLGNTVHFFKKIRNKK